MAKKEEPQLELTEEQKAELAAEEEQELLDIDEDSITPIPDVPSRNDAPKEYIAHSKRLEKLKLALVEETANIKACFDVDVEFIPYPPFIYVSVGDLAPLKEGERDPFEQVIEAVIQKYAEQNYKVWTHYSTYLRVAKNNKRALADIKNDAEKMTSRVKGFVTRFDFCYSASFEEYARSIVDVPTNKKGNKYICKSIVTKYGTFGFTKTGGTKVEDSSALDDRLMALFKLANSQDTRNDYETPELYIAHLAEREKAKAALKALPVRFTPAIEIGYDPKVLKNFATEYKLPGFVTIPDNELGSLSVTG